MPRRQVRIPRPGRRRGTVVYRERTWDCQDCADQGIVQIGIPASMHVCPHGHPRNEFMSPTEADRSDPNGRTLTDAAEISRAESFGNGIVCLNCEFRNPDTALNCENCGDPIDRKDYRSASVHHIAPDFLPPGVTYSPDNSRRDDVYNTTMDELEDPSLRAQELVDGDTSPFGGEELIRPITDAVERSAVQAHFDELQRLSEAARQPPLPKLSSLPRPSSRTLLIAGSLSLVAILMSLVAIAIIKAMQTAPEQVSVVGLDWEHRIEIQEYRYVAHEGWNVPYNGRTISSRVEQIGTSTTIVGTSIVEITGTSQRYTGTTTYACGIAESEDIGDYDRVTEAECTDDVYDIVDVVTGTSIVNITDSYPVYGPYYRYEVKEWTHYSYLTATGDGTTKPYDPEFTACSTAQFRLCAGNELRRNPKGDAREYFVTVKDQRGATHRERVPDLATYLRLSTGSTITGNFHDTDLRSIDWDSA